MGAFSILVVSFFKIDFGGGPAGGFSHSYDLVFLELPGFFDDEDFKGCFVGKSGFELTFFILNKFILTICVKLLLSSRVNKILLLLK